MGTANDCTLVAKQHLLVGSDVSSFCSNEWVAAVVEVSPTVVTNRESEVEVGEEGQYLARVWFSVLAGV